MCLSVYIIIQNILNVNAYFSKYSEFVGLHKKVVIRLDTLHKILDLMWKNGISDAELCSRAHINKSAVTDWKKGKTKSYMRYLPEIAEVLGTTVSYLKDETNTKEKQSSSPSEDISEERKELHSLIDRLPPERRQEAAEILKSLIKHSGQK